MRGRRRAAALVAGALVIGMTGCSPALPETVVPGTEVVVGWTGELTSANAVASPTSGNVDVAAMTRGRFGDIIDGDFVPDEGFGSVTIVNEDPFTVRYDLAEPSWSDGIPLDAADLLLGWAGTAGFFTQSEDADAPEATIAGVDEFARSIDVKWPHPRSDWQSAVPVPVPAHVLGVKAFGIDDPMEAKLAVITAIRDGDDDAIQKMANVWNEGFTLDGAKDAEDLLVSSGPFIVDEVASAGQEIVLTPNTSYRGLVSPQVARIELAPPGDDPAAAVGTALDIARVAPVAANQAQIHELERKDLTVSTTQDGTVWAVLLNPTGAFTSTQARTAFFHAIPPNALMTGGAGQWGAAYTPTTSMIVSTESRAYEVVNEDSGFTTSLATTEGDPPLEREAAGMADGSPVCVLYDRKSEFARGAFAAMRDTAAEAGWKVVDCGSDDFAAALEQRSWNAVIANVPIPDSPAEIAAEWGSDSVTAITRHSDPDRDTLIAELAVTTDVYDVRELQAQIEATIVRAAVALPIAVNPVVTIIDKDVTGVSPRNGAPAPLTSGAAQWSVIP